MYNEFESFDNHEPRYLETEEQEDPKFPIILESNKDQNPKNKKRKFTYDEGIKNNQI